MKKIKLYPSLQRAVDSLDLESISPERKEVLEDLVSFISGKLSKGNPVHLNFICTHNSRRSQFSQVWAQVASDYYGVNARCYSGGVEVTAFNERAVASLERTGFTIEKEGDNNPKYSVFYAEDCDPVVAFSKVFDDPVNSSDGFAAVMTCAHADENCPFIPGAEARIPVRYDDPKAFDDTPQESDKYDERSRQIATEMFYVFNKLSK